MKRRSFLQSVIGGVTVLFLPKAKAGVDDIVNETLAKDPNWRDTQIQCPCDRCNQVRNLSDRQHTAIYVGRQFRVKGKRVKWSKVGEKEQMWIRYDYDEFSYMDFSPNTMIIAISNIDGRLIVDCEHSIWEIEENVYGDGFQKKLISYL